MHNTDFNPYDMLINLQNIQHQQAENMVKVSEWMMENSQEVAVQRHQLDAIFNIIKQLQQITELQSQRIKLLESHSTNGINNTTSKETIPTWDL